MDKKCEDIFFRMNEEEHSWEEHVSYIDKAIMKQKS